MELENGVPYAFPNDEVHWTIMIVLYPYITGLVVGAFIIASLHYVFGVRQLRPVAKFALVTTVSFLCFATAPLLLHLGHPERSFSIMITPNPRSAMAGFGFIYSGFFLLVATMLWLTFRPVIVERANQPGPFRPLYRLASLGVTTIPDEARELDRKVVTVLAAIGIPTACLLSGYVGFIFGTVKANPWWRTPLTPVIFLLSSMVSGISLLVILYWLSCKLRRVAVDQACMRSLAGYLWSFLIVGVSMELLEVLVLAYESTEDWPIIQEMMSQKIGTSFFGIQFLLGSLVPFVLLGWAVLSGKTGRKLEFAAYLSGFLILLQVLATRWNVVIGGQSFSKSFRALQDYVPPLGGREGFGMSMLILAAPFVVILVLSKLLPVWEEDRAHARA